MAIEKIKDSEVAKLNVKSASDTPQGSSTDIKQIFDNLPEFIVKKFNELVDTMTGSADGKSGADNIASAPIDGISGANIREQLKSAVGLILDRYTKEEIKSLFRSETNTLISEVDVNLSSGVITVKQKDGTTKTFDTALEKVPAKFEFVEEGEKQYIKITNVDGTSTKTDVSQLMNIYEFANSEHINVSVTNVGNKKQITASLRDGSIGIDKLNITAISTMQDLANKCENAQNAVQTMKADVSNMANNVASNMELTKQKADLVQTTQSTVEGYKNEAVSNADKSKSYAVGQTGTRVGEDADNAKYYAEKAKEEADRASNLAGGDFATRAELTTETTARAQAIQAEETARATKDTELEQKINNIPEIVINNTLTSGSATEALSAAQGKVLKEKTDKALTLELYDGDLNNLHKAGFYSLRGCANRPDGNSSYATVLVSKTDSTVNDSATDTMQMYIDQSNDIYVRNCTNKTNAWTEWKKIGDNSAMEFYLQTLNSADENTKIQSGTASQNSSGWTTVFFDEAFEGIPQVFIQVIDTQAYGAVKNIQPNCFNYCTYNQNGNATKSSIYFLAIYKEENNA